MLIRVNREARPEERRVALVPKSVADLVSDGHRVSVAAGAGAAAGFDDEAYRDAGASVVDDASEGVDLLVAVEAPTGAVDASAVMGFLDPLGSPDRIAELASGGVTVLAVELVPRTTLAQTMDALSSQATAAGYEAVLLGAELLPRFLPMLMTAAGTIPPARVLVLGAGVAGLQAIATARRLGAIVSAYDIRAAAREQVESLGAEFVGGPVEEVEAVGGYAGEVDEETRRAQQEALADAVAAADLVIGTAQVPGRAAPILLTAPMVATMRPAAVVVDAAAPTGGNCELTAPGRTVVHHDVTIVGPLDLAGRTAAHASEMYSRNLTALIRHLSNDDLALVIDPDDEIAAGVCVATGGVITDDRVAAALEAS